MVGDVAPPARSAAAVASEALDFDASVKDEQNAEDIYVVSFEKLAWENVVLFKSHATPSAHGQIDGTLPFRRSIPSMFGAE